MVIKIKEFEKKMEEIKQNEHLSNKEIAEIMEMDYTYLFRIFNENATPGRKAIIGIEKFCQKFNLNSRNFIFLE